MVDSFVYVTGNRSKIAQARAVSPIGFEHADIDLTEIQSLDSRIIVEKKARQAYKQLKKPVLVEDVSFEIDELNGLPGPLIKWFLEKIGPSGLCGLVRTNRKATARITYMYFNGTDKHFFEVHSNGMIAEQELGENGFGFDKVFIPDGSTKTYAEMTSEEFMKVSLRRKALAQLAVFIKAQK